MVAAGPSILHTAPMRPVLVALLATLCVYGQQKLEFDVASVKPSPDGEQSGFSLDTRNGRFSARNIDVFHLIEVAYRLNDLRLPDVPSWTKSARFDIQAQAADPGATSDDQVLVMLQALLEDRFQLKFHRVMREQTAYALSADGRGLKLSPAGEAQNGTLRLGNVDAPSISMKTLTALLEFELERPVVDRTGVTSNFAIRLEWASRKIAADAESAKPSLVTALREQLGLKLEATKAPLEVVVIDRVERPSEN